MSGPTLTPPARARVSSRPVRTTLMIELSGDHLILRGPVYNRELCVRMLRKALECIGDGQPAQTDAGPGGQRLLIPVGSKLEDLYHHGRKKI